jgi:acyl-CoA synthetase (AMP-forming)/AMP-acid ligase II
MSECVCYGVQVPGSEGRACMVAIVEHPNCPIDLHDLLDKLKHQLPSYAVPLFVRLARNVQYTATFKLQKQQLKQQEYDLNKVTDPLFVINDKRTDYVTLDRNRWDDIKNSNGRF